MISLLFTLSSNADTPDIDGKFNLTWSLSTGADNYSIYEYNSTISEYHSDLTLIDEGVVVLEYEIIGRKSEIYYYMVIAFNETGNTTSNCISVTVEILYNGFYRVSPFILDATGGGDFTWSQLVGKPWFSGSGTYGAPYIIQSIIIEGKNITSCLEIRNSRDPFIIFNSTFHNSGSGFYDAGILLDNNTNSNLLEINCSFNNGHGIFLKNSWNSTISYNILFNNSYNGIYIDPSYDNIITYNTANFNDIYGIFLEDSCNNTIINNFANNNDNYGIYLENCTENEVLSNIINDNTLYGIFLNNSHFNEISHNNIDNNPTGIFLNNSNYNTVLNNIITGYDAGKAIMEFNCTGNIFALSSTLIGGDDDSSSKEKSETLDIMIFIIIIGILGAISGAGFFLVKRSRVKLREKEIEIETLKKQREQITEDDIAISKEKHFCIVHRGPIGGYNYICTECGTYYCIKCLDAIIDIENSCWSCKKPLDPSKVIKSVDDKDDIKPIIEENSDSIDNVSESVEKRKKFIKKESKNIKK